MNALSLFSGIGGLDIAAEWAGFKTVAFCERDEFCQKVLRKHWPDVRIYDDVRTLDTRDLPKIELLHGGYPCQPFSTAGNRRGEADERHMWPHMLRIVREIKPRWVVGENVKGHITLGLDTVCNDLEGEGYAVRAICIPACAIGAVHRRERVFILAHAAGDGRNEGATSGSDAPSDGESAERQDEDCQHEGRGGLRLELDWRGREVGGWGVEPPEIRVDARLPNRVDRNRAVGNSVSPQQAYPIFAAIAETYNAELSGATRLYRGTSRLSDGLDAAASQERRLKMIAALYVETDGAYFGLDGVEPWDEAKDARRYTGPHPVVAHPPCQRWGRYWHGAPMKPNEYRLGEDGGCFAAALTAVRNYGGVLEHPAHSNAWRFFGLATPPKAGGWVKADEFGGWTCHVEQGHYGHMSRKATWLYAVGTERPELTWGPSEQRIHPVALAKHGYEKARRIGMVAMVGGKDKTRIRNATPPEFRDLLLAIARSANKASND